MKEISYKDLKIRIQEEPDYDFGSADNKPYDKIIRIEESDFYKCLSLSVQNEGELTTVLLIVSYYTPVHSLVAEHPQGLFLMLNSIICVFDPITCSVIKQVDIDPTGTMFEVHRYQNDYILYGEMEIYRVTPELEVLWIFFGRDIFVRYMSDEPAFEMKEDRICLYDFEDNYYEVDYDGREIL